LAEFFIQLLRARNKNERKVSLESFPFISGWFGFDGARRGEKLAIVEEKSEVTPGARQSGDECGELEIKSGIRAYGWLQF
jgi:hypothetical protein